MEVETWTQQNRTFHQKQRAPAQAGLETWGRGGKWRIGINRVNTSRVQVITESQMRYKWETWLWSINPTKGALTLTHEIKNVLLFSKVLALPHSCLYSTFASLLLSSLSLVLNSWCTHLHVWSQDYLPQSIVCYQDAIPRLHARLTVLNI